MQIQPVELSSMVYAYMSGLAGARAPNRCKLLALCDTFGSKADNKRQFLHSIESIVAPLITTNAIFGGIVKLGETRKIATAAKYVAFLIRPRSAKWLRFPVHFGLFLSTGHDSRYYLSRPLPCMLSGMYSFWTWQRMVRRQWCISIQCTYLEHGIRKHKRTACGCGCGYNIDNILLFFHAVNNGTWLFRLKNELTMLRPSSLGTCSACSPECAFGYAQRKVCFPGRKGYSRFPLDHILLLISQTEGTATALHCISSMMSMSTRDTTWRQAETLAETVHYACH